MAKFDVGGQAVIEGVMMRSPRSFAVVCRRPSGEIVIKEAAWQPVWAALRFLRWPFFRGSVILVESLVNGLDALSFAARQQTIEATAAPGGPDGLRPAGGEAERSPVNRPRSLGARAADPSEEGMSKAATYGMLAVSLAFGLALFVGVPHLLAWLLGTLFGFDSSTFVFHIVDGAIKAVMLIGYLGAISLLPDVRRVFQYHGAEHKSIATYEAGLPLTVENARAQSRFHPRCGTSFLLIVVAVSIVLFAVLLRGQISSVPLIDNLAKILLKLPLMLPVAGLAYELLKLSGARFERAAWARALAKPGLLLQKITTREPDDAQLEVALISIRKTLWRERQAGGPDGLRPAGDEAERSPFETAAGTVEIFPSAAEVPLPVS